MNTEKYNSNLFNYTYNNNMINIPKNWRPFFNDNTTRDIIKNISDILTKDYISGHIINPNLNYIWSPFFYTSYNELKVIILGDQPYNQYDKNILTNEKSNFNIIKIINNFKQKYNNDDNNDNNDDNNDNNKHNNNINKHNKDINKDNNNINKDINKHDINNIDKDNKDNNKNNIINKKKNNKKKNNKKKNNKKKNINNYVKSYYDKFNENTNINLYNNSNNNNDNNIDILNYCNQGVMFINNTLTIKHIDKNSYTRLWKMFMIYLFEYISINKNGIVFILWGPYNKKFSTNINKTKHYIIENTLPNYKNTFYNYNNLQQCNDLLIKNDIPPIKWW
jgi:uracil DNA glycosylase